MLPNSHLIIVDVLQPHIKPAVLNVSGLPTCLEKMSHTHRPLIKVSTLTVYFSLTVKI